MAKFKKTQDKQAPSVRSTKTSIVKKRKKEKANALLNGIHKNDLKKSSTSNEIANNTYMNIQCSKKKEQRGFKNKLGAKDTEKSDVPTKYRKSDKKNSEVFQKKQINARSKTKQKIKNKNKFGTKDTERSHVPTRYRKDEKNSEVFKKLKINTNNKTRKMKNKNKLGAEDTETLDVSTKYPKNNKRTSEVYQKVQINTSKTERKKKNKKRKQDINLHHANKSAATIDDTEEKNKKLQMPTKNLERRKTKIEKLKKINEKKVKRISAEVEAPQIKRDNIIKWNKHKINIKQLEKMLANKLQLKPEVKQLTLRDRMLTQLRASRFRFINEILYNNDSSQSKNYFKTDPDAFMAYHAGYKQQLEQWAVNPLDVIISSIKKLPMDNVIADFGCGEARLATSVPHTVHSFDFVALNDKVKACDMAHTPLLMNSVHVVVFCLSLMGSNLNDYIIEANRILKNNGILKIAEVESRFEDVKDFIRLLCSYGFKNTWKDLSHNLFYFMDFRKEEDISMKRKNLPPITLKSCLYKKGNIVLSNIINVFT